MSKQPTPEALGLAAELLYGSGQETKSNLHQSRQRSKPKGSYTSRLRRYEMKKAQLKQRNLSSAQYERQIKQIAERLGV